VHAGGKEFIERVDFGILPGRFLLLPSGSCAISRYTFAQRRVRSGAHQIHRGLFAALERADDLVDYAIIGQA